MARPIAASYGGIVAIVRTWCDKASCRRKGWPPPRPPTGRHRPPCVLPYTPIVAYQATISITSLRSACGEACRLHGEETMPMDRRSFLTQAGAVAGVAAAFPAPAIAQGIRELKLVTSWPKGLPGLGTSAERLGGPITAITGGRRKGPGFWAAHPASPLQVI